MELDKAIALTVDTILRDGLSDITSESLELDLIGQFRTEFEAEVRAKLNRGNVDDMEFRPLQHILTPKNRHVFDYRKAAILTPACAAKYLALVFQYADIVEEARVSVDQNVVFSCRFNPTSESVFDKSIGYSQWREQTKILASQQSCEYVVSCDIAAFYDRVNIHRIESTLLSIGVPQQLVQSTNKLLLFWSKKDSYGIPVGNIASRVLAEAALIDIDQYLIDQGIVFTRYVDDFRLFAPNLIVAQEWMNKLTTRLFRDGLMLNVGKTQIREAESGKGDEEPEKVSEKAEEASETVLKVITKLTGGYNRIARRFIMPAEDKHKDFEEIDLPSEIETLKQQCIVEFEGIQKVVIATLIQKKFDMLMDVAKICSSYLYGLDYFIDMLLKNVEFIPGDYKEQIADFYAGLIEGEELYSFEWHCASVARLLSHESYFRKSALIHLYISPAKDVSTYASLIALEGLKGKLTRSEFLTLREYFERSDEWEKRRLIALSDSLPEDEQKAWARAIKPLLAYDFLGEKHCREIINGRNPV